MPNIAFDDENVKMNLWIIFYIFLKKKTNIIFVLHFFYSYFVWHFFVCVIIVVAGGGILLKQKQNENANYAIRWNMKSINRYEHTSKWNCSWAHFLCVFVVIHSPTLGLSLLVTLCISWFAFTCFKRLALSSNGLTIYFRCHSVNCFSI